MRNAFEGVNISSASVATEDPLDGLEVIQEEDYKEPLPPLKEEELKVNYDDGIGDDFIF